MPRFLHLADIHLGFDRYNHPERTKDFYRALEDVLTKYALEPAVDFVVIAGDLFEQRQILPFVLNQAKLCLDMLQDAGIPVLAIEGNHDNRPYGTKTSWLRYLSDWGHLILLEPNEEATTPEERYQPWDGKRGGYIDLDCGVRVIGSQWYGAMAPQAIAQLAESIHYLPPAPDYTVMLFHHGLAGQIARYSGALRYEDLLPLREAGVDYLALGHIHKHYTEDNWVFNPGSLEANSIVENKAQMERGVYLVELAAGGIQAELKRDYYQRPHVRLEVAAKKQQSLEEVEQAAIACVQAAADKGKTPDAIVELRITGQVGFNRSDFPVRQLQEQLHNLSRALIFLLKYEAVGTEYQSPLLGDGETPPTRLEIETQVFTDLLAANYAYAEQAEPLAASLIALKTQVLDNQPEADLYTLAETLLTQSLNP